ncbi:MAG: hypothetical protein AAFQ79_12760 [Pseudomonadota bacterium]
MTAPLIPPAPQALHTRPWQTLTEADLGPAVSVPTMLAPEERKLYLWLARHCTGGDGAIVDLGCFAGGSTAYLAEGARQAGHGQHVHGFDRFSASEVAKNDVLYPAGIPPFEGTQILSLAQRLLAPWAPDVTLYPGPIEAHHWTGPAIELLVIDAAKSAEVADRIAASFFPALIPGQSLVVQQDLLHWKTPWLPAQMEFMADCFRPVAHCAPDTVVFQCTRAVRPESLEAGRVRARRDSVLAEAVMAMGARLAPWDLGPRLETSLEALRRNPNKRRAKDFTERP